MSAGHLFNYYHNTMDWEKSYGPIDVPSHTRGPLLREQERYMRTAFSRGHEHVWTEWGNLGRVTVHEALPVCFG